MTETRRQPDLASRYAGEMNDVVGGSTEWNTERSRAFWMRLADNLFRRLPILLIPLLAMGAVGLYRVSGSTPMYRSESVLSAASNPLLTDTEIRGTSLQPFESPAAGTSRIINEQIRTAAFTSEVVRRAGLIEAVEQGLLTLEVVSDSIRADEDGNSLLTISAEWSDPETSLRLVTATIDAYVLYLTDTVASDSSEAEQFYTELRDEAEAKLQDAQAELASLLATLPELGEGEEQPLEVVVRIDSLTNRVGRAEEQLQEAQDNIELARLAVLQSRSEAGRSLLVVDEPQLPEEPESNVRDNVITIGVFTLLGGTIAFLLLLVFTMLDRSVRTTADLDSIPGLSLVAVVPPLDSRKAASARRRAARSRSSKSPPPASTIPIDEKVTI